jgi:hypothetical protein
MGVDFLLETSSCATHLRAAREVALVIAVPPSVLKSCNPFLKRSSIVSHHLVGIVTKSGYLGRGNLILAAQETTFAP